jgi:hypothetical protein
VEVDKRLLVDSKYDDGSTSEEPEEGEAFMPGIEILSSNSEVAVSAGKDLTLTARRGRITLWSRRSILLVGTRLLARLTHGLFSINKNFTVRGGSLDARSIKTNSLISRNIFSTRRIGGDPEHENHVFSIPPGGEGDPMWSPVEFGEQESDLEPEELEEEEERVAGMLAGWSPVTSGTAFALAEAQEYNPDLVVEGDDTKYFMETVTQQELRMQAPDGYASWIDPEPEAMWPGPGSAQLKLSSGVANSLSLDEPLSIPYTQLKNRGSDMQASAFVNQRKNDS